jgi:hypothetical protein
VNLNLRIILFFLFIVLVSSNCLNYGFKGALPSYLKTIYISLFEDQTYRVGLREELTNKVNDAFIRDNTLTVVDNPDSADLVITGKITRIQEKYVAITEQENVEERQYWVFVKVECLNTKINKNLWAENLSRFGVVSAAGDIDAIDEAIDFAVDDLVEDILTKTIAAW